MSERPVEELIFTRETGDVSGVRGWFNAAGEWRARAEVDDLAAWLDGWWTERWADDANWTGAWWSLVHDEAEDGRTYWYVEPIDNDPDGDVWPTIRDALVAAVRKVAES